MTTTGTYGGQRANLCDPSPPSTCPGTDRLILPSATGAGDPLPGYQPTKPAVPCQSIPPAWIQLAWPVQGDRIPADHGYRLYSALVERLPGLKELGWSLKTINGIPDRQGWVQLGSESWLGVRTELANLELFGSLDGQVLRVGKALVQLGTLTGASLQPCPSLEARLVTIKAQYQDQVSPFEFGIALGKALERLGVQAMPVLGERKTLRIKDAAVVGYGVSFADLSPEASLTLQRQGLGGRQRLGCGYFVEKC